MEYVRHMIAARPLLYGTLRCLLTLAACILPCAAVLAPVRFLTRIPRFVFRKLLHLVALGSVAAMLLLAEDWKSAALACCVAAVAVYPLLTLLEREPWYAALLAEKKPGEVKRSLSLYFLTVAALAALAWGAAGRRDVAAAALLMWGAGDALAALVGIPFGRHKVKWRIADGNKSWEGSLAMFAAAFLSGFIALLCLSGAPAGTCLWRSALGAAVAALAELVSGNGADTVTVPAAAAVALWLASL